MNFLDRVGYDLDERLGDYAHESVFRLIKFAALLSLYRVVEVMRSISLKISLWLDKTEHNDDDLPPF